MGVESLLVSYRENSPYNKRPREQLEPNMAGPSENLLC